MSDPFALERLRQARAELVEALLDRSIAKLSLALKLWNPDQPRVPAGSLGGGQWVDSSGRANRTNENHRIRLAGDITGFTKHGINQAITRGVSPRAILDAVNNPIKVVPQSNGTVRYIGAGAAVVLNPAGSVVTVWGQ